METLYFYTEEPLDTNSLVMDYYVGHLSDDLFLYYIEATYAEGCNKYGANYEVHASGNGDYNNHKIEFVKMEVNT